MRSLPLALCLSLALCMPVGAETDDEPIAPHRITVVMTPGITAWWQLPSDDLVEARRRLAQKGAVSTGQMRRLADLGDGFAALRFAQHLEKFATQPRAADIAHYYGVAAATGRGGAIVNMIRFLDQIDPTDVSPQRLALLKSIVVAYANAGNSAAADALVRYHWRQVPFGPLYDEVDVLLANLNGELAAELSLDQSLAILQDHQHTRDDLVNVQAYLATARASESLQTRIVAQNLEAMLAEAMARQTTLQNERVE
ncbi:hypothetical protein [Yoonia sp. 2307UL14-13]|uniref:hypothetical protein n=1 Tax=Yoonia sp. 2307UL14-13 TaxID=3126506 RepID=UPI0030AF16F8